MPTSYTLEQINSIKPSKSRLTALYFTEKKVNRQRYVWVKCICGNEKEVSVSEVTSGGTASCGCLGREKTILRNTKYSKNVPEISACWHDMLARCYKDSCKNYRWYGAKGVIVCDEWKNDYETFLDWALRNGWKKGYHLDKDIKGSGFLYSPSTCMFVESKINLEAKGTLVRNKKGQFAWYVK
jgi:hypothetical protein